jgi:hypothetical protein
MNKIEDIEMIDVLMVEQLKPLNKIGITALECGASAEAESRVAGANPVRRHGIGDDTCGRARGSLDLSEPDARKTMTSFGVTSKRVI